MSGRLSHKVKSCLNKARESALLGVEIYNKPSTKFKSGGYIVLMCIAWTSLFHAIFFKRGVKPYYREKNGIRFERQNGELRFWELSTCIREYFGSQASGIKKNIELFIPLRNMIEHKFMPELDADLFAECQSLVMNFDKILEKEFGEDNCIREALTFSLQLFPSSRTLEMAVQYKQNPDVEKITRFIHTYRENLGSDILQSGEYSFKAFLIQVANHQSQSALPIQFLNYETLTDEQKESVARLVSMTKEKQIPVANKGTMKPGIVVQTVQEKLGNPKVLQKGKEVNFFTLHKHTDMWKKYKIRPDTGAMNPERTKTEFCIYDEPNNSYLYTTEWVNFLVRELEKDLSHISQL